MNIIPVIAVSVLVACSTEELPSHYSVPPYTTPQKGESYSVLPNAAYTYYKNGELVEFCNKTGDLEFTCLYDSDKQRKYTVDRLTANSSSESTLKLK